MPLLLRVPACAAVLLAGCQTLVEEPWTSFPENAKAAGVMVGWNGTEGDLSVQGDPLGGGPIEGELSELSFETDTVFDLGVEGDYYLTENWLLGARIEWRSNQPQAFDLPFEEISYRFRGDDYTTTHFALGLRYLFDPMGRSLRYRSFLGVELSYVPELNTEFQVESSLNQTELVSFEGDGLYALGARGGMAILLTDDTVLEIGVLWEWALGGYEDTVVFGDGPNGANPTETTFEIEPDTMVGFVTLKGSL